MAKKEKDEPVGVVMQNAQVSAFTRKHGPALFSKPHGPEKTILYYSSEEYLKGRHEAAGGAGALGFNRRPGAVFRGRRGAEIENMGNPNRALADAKIINKGDLDKEVIKIEKDDLEAKTEDEGTTTSEKVAKVDQKEVKKDPDKVVESATKDSSKK